MTSARTAGAAGEPAATERSAESAVRSLDVERTRDASLLMNEVQLLLAEKRTSLAALRTGIAVFVLPLSVLSFLIVTSRYYSAFQVLHLLIPVLLMAAALAVLGSYLIVRATIRIRRHDQHISELRTRSPLVAELID